MSGTSSEPLGEPLPDDSVFYNVPYTNEVDDAHRQLDLYLPANRTSTHPPTLLVYVHGGLWMDRDKKEYQHIGRYYTTKGLAVAVVNYRQTQHKPAPPAAAQADTGDKDEDMSTIIRHPTHTLDLAAALTFLTTGTPPPHIPTSAYNRRQLVAFGHSCGAHMLALLTTNPALRPPAATLSALVGYVGCEGLYSLSQYAAAHPDWSSDLYRVFPQWDDPTAQNAPSEGASTTWLVLHSSGDAWVERGQAEGLGAVVG